MSGIEDIKEKKWRPINWSHMLKVKVDEDRMGSITITFLNGYSIFVQAEHERDSFIEALVYYEDTDSYYISDEYLQLAEKEKT